jgi:tetratricopeptide (TPR) repeat protein
MRKLIFVSLFVLILQFGAVAQSFESGIKLARVGDFENALPHFQTSIDKNLSRQKLAQIHYNIGVCFYQLKQLDKAVTEFEQAVKLNPNYEKAFYALGMAEADLQHWSGAEKAFRQVLKLSKGRHGEAWFDLAFVYVGQKKYDEAFASFQKAINFGSKSVGASHNNLGVIYAIKGDLQMANKEIETAQSLGFSEAENNLAVLRKFMNLPDRTLIANLIKKERTNEQ